jgi:hypothetical protein
MIQIIRSMEGGGALEVAAIMSMGGEQNHFRIWRAP